MKFKRKAVYHYRGGNTHENCELCHHFRVPVGITLRAGGVPGPSKARCAIIGRGVGKYYDIDTGGLCDAYKRKG